MAQGSFADGLFGFSFAMFAIGVVVLALGMSAYFASLHLGQVDNRIMVLGYVVMRLAMLFQWLRVAREAPQYRRAALTYAATLAVAQAGWTALAVLNTSMLVFIVVGAVLLVVELAGPYLAETRKGGTPWHTHHIAERYSLMAIITLGEGVVGTIAALAPIITTAGWTLEAVLIVTAGVGLTFGLWWVYFSVDFAGPLSLRRGKSFVFGYGHMVLFGSIAAVGAGLHVAGYVLAGEATIGTPLAVASVALPLMVFMVVVTVLYTYLYETLDRFHLVLITAVVLALGASLALAASGVSLGCCLLVATLAPAIVIVAYERVGHEHQRSHLASLAGSEPDA